MIALVLWWAIGLYVWILVARALISFVPLLVPGWTPRGVVLVVAEGIYSLTDPPLKALGKLIPPVRLGTVALDVSFLVLLIGLQILQTLVATLPI